ncbi:MAG: hypothetical protein J0M30_15850 [Chitinophagales bacterium]|nr:hypothetical protein [Chitinophagales bacterium]
MTLPKRSVAFLFLLVVLAPLSYAITVVVKEQMIHWKMRDKLGRDQLLTITLKADDVVWMDKHEILVDGYMFDISTRKLENGVYTFTGLFDKEETSLVKNHQGHHDRSKDSQTQLLQSIFSLTAITPEASAAETHFINHSCIYPAYLTLRIQSPVLDQLTPPPQTVADFS